MDEIGTRRDQESSVPRAQAMRRAVRKCTKVYENGAALIARAMKRPAAHTVTTSPQVHASVPVIVFKCSLLIPSNAFRRRERSISPVSVSAVLSRRHSSLTAYKAFYDSP